MANINLLPWRELRRAEREKHFMIALGVTLAVGVSLIFLGDRLLNTAIDNQKARNGFMRKEISILDKRIKEIKQLQERRQQLLARMETIQGLQGNRPIITHVFDQMVRTLPDGVYFNQLKMNGKRIALNGVAESNRKVSALMRSLDASAWLTQPNLTEVKVVKLRNGTEGSQFTLSVQQTRPEQAPVEGEEQGGRP